jgi:hypothetical protein
MLLVATLQGEIDEALELLTAATRQPSARSAGAGTQLLRLYEHFMFAMANKGQHEVAAHLARHLKARGLRHTSGTASALLSSQVGPSFLLPGWGWGIFFQGLSIQPGSSILLPLPLLVCTHCTSGC